MRRLVAVLAAIAVLVVVSVSAASGADAQRVTITSVMTITGNGTNTGTFVATGPAVTSHLICSSGTVTDVYIDLSDPTDFPVVKAFVCDAGGPTFLVSLHVTEGFTWGVQGGSGPYRGLYGSGTGSTIGGPGDQQVTDIYTGTLRSTTVQNGQ